MLHDGHIVLQQQYKLYKSNSSTVTGSSLYMKWKKNNKY